MSSSMNDWCWFRIIIHVYDSLQVTSSEVNDMQHVFIHLYIFTRLYTVQIFTSPYSCPPLTHNRTYHFSPVLLNH
jgi:hypothetical protein